MTVGHCGWCNAQLPLSGKRGDGQARKYCNDKCRWQAWNKSNPRQRMRPPIDSGRVYCLAGDHFTLGQCQEHEGRK